MIATAYSEAGIVTALPGGQTGFANDWANRMIALEGGWGAGKTFIGARKLLTLHIHNAFDESGEATYVPSAAIAPTYGNAMDYVVPELLTAADEVGLTCNWHGNGSAITGGFSGPALTIPALGRKDKPSVIIIRTADAPKRITGWQVGAGWGDEPARWAEDWFYPARDSYLQFTGRVRHPLARFVQIMFTGTNEGDATRIYMEMHNGKKGRKWYRARTIDNPSVRDFYEQQSDSLTKELARQYLNGEAVSLRGGLVYPSFDKSIHVDDQVQFDFNHPICLAVDFNISPGMHAEIGQYWPERDEFAVVAEIHASRMDVRAMVRAFVKIAKSWPPDWLKSPLEVYGDASGRAHWAGTGQSCYDMLIGGLKDAEISFRMNVRRANPPVVDRINAVEVALMDLRGAQHLRIHSRCDRLINDLRRLRRDESGGVNKADRKLSHASDALGYWIHWVRPVRGKLNIPRGRYSVKVAR